VYRNKENPRQWLARSSGFNSPQHLGPLSGHENFPQMKIWGKGDSPRATNHDRLPPWRWADSSAAQLLPDPLQAEGKTTLHQEIGI